MVRGRVHIQQVVVVMTGQSDRRDITVMFNLWPWQKSTFKFTEASVQPDPTLFLSSVCSDRLDTWPEAGSETAALQV